MKNETNTLLFGHNIDRYFDDMMKDLKTLLSIPSIASDQTDRGPFGDACADALDFMLNRADDFGLDTGNVGYYAGDAIYGDKDSYIDILTHLDVVPTGDGWNSDPFDMIVKDGKIYARGIADDKGPAIITLYALKALKDAGIQGRHSLRAIFGCGEEISSKDLDVYYKRKGFPVMGFTPDAEYGICCNEKGILHLTLTGDLTSDCVVRDFHAGTAVNAVPADASAALSCTESQYEQLISLAEKEPSITVKKSDDLILVTASGKAAHGAEPWLGDNAITRLTVFLSSVFSPKELGCILTFLSEKIKREVYGETLAISCSDEESGKLSLNLGTIQTIDGRLQITFDIRYPVTATLNSVLNPIKEAAALYHVEITDMHHVAPLHVPKQSRLINILSASYKAATGSNCEIYSTGGGTYARHANNRVVAFGPVFPEQSETFAHGPNEQFDVEYFKQHARICLEAMYRLCMEIE